MVVLEDEEVDEEVELPGWVFSFEPPANTENATMRNIADIMNRTFFTISSFGRLEY